jgi:putative solute:sodium symporter small subunit
MRGRKRRRFSPVGDAGSPSGGARAFLASPGNESQEDEGSEMSDIEQSGRWRATARLSLAVVVTLVILVLFFVSLVGAPDQAGYPLGLVVAATGLPVAIILLVFWFARRQERIDERHGLYED